MNEASAIQPKCAICGHDISDPYKYYFDGLFYHGRCHSHALHDAADEMAVDQGDRDEHGGGINVPIGFEAFDELQDRVAALELAIEHMVRDGDAEEEINRETYTAEGVEQVAARTWDRARGRWLYATGCNADGEPLYSNGAVARLLAQVSELSSMLTMAEAALEYEQTASEVARKERDIANKRVSELLARIHSDGGHHEAEHGTEYSIEQAHVVVATLLAHQDAARYLRNKTPRAAGE